MTFFQTHFKKNWIRLACGILLFVLLLLVCSYTADNIRNSNAAEQEAILGKAVERSITECYALEGAYPPDIANLSEHYGLTYDQTQYFIDYQYIGSNLRPDVTIIKRN